MTLYETDTFEYRKLSDLLRTMADFYDKVINPHETRVACEFFRVAYYGRGFPVFWRDRAFVYRGRECDNIRDFTERMQNRFPGCVTLKTMDVPSREILQSEGCTCRCVWNTISELFGLNVFLLIDSFIFDRLFFVLIIFC